MLRVSQPGATSRRNARTCRDPRVGPRLSVRIGPADSVASSYGPRLLRPGFYPEWMLDLGGIDVEEIATALADQTDYEHRWLVDPRTGQVAFWTSDTGIDGENPVEIEELELILIDPLPSYVWTRTWPTLLTASATAQSADS